MWRRFYSSLQETGAAVDKALLHQPLNQTTSNPEPELFEVMVNGPLVPNELHGGILQAQTYMPQAITKR